MTAKTLWRWASLIFVLVASLYFIGYATEHIRGLPPISWGRVTWVALVASIILWSGIIILGAVIWKSLLMDLNCHLNWHDCVTIYGLAQFGKYLPGNVGHHVGRVVLAKQAGVPAAATLQTMLIEMVWSIGVASGIALFGVVLGGDIGVSSAALTLFFVVALMAPWAAWGVARTFFPKLLARVTNGTPIALPRLGTLMLASLLYLAAFMVAGLVMDMHARLLFGAQTSHVFMLTAIFAWSWIAGYITPGAPAGLGVREAVLVSSLTPIYGASVAVGLTLSLRVVTTLGDGMVFLIAIARSRFSFPYGKNNIHSDFGNKSIFGNEDKQ